MEASFRKGWGFFCEDVQMIVSEGHFYYINDRYFVDFPDDKLMHNKEMVDGQAHDRPCFYAFCDSRTGLYWMIPFSSRTEKFRRYYESKINRYGKCDTIVFGHVLGHEKAFLIQNMCPVTEKYIKNEYIDKAAIPVRIDRKTEAELLAKAKRVLALQRKGICLIFPNVLQIEQKLINDIST